MEQIKRSDFLSALAGNMTATEDGNKQVPVNEFANKTLPHFGSRSSTGLNQYTGTFGQAELAHLLRRTLFGVTKADLTYFNGMTLDQVVAALLTPASTPLPPVNAYNNTNQIDADIQPGQTWVNAASNANSVSFNSKRLGSMKQWWVGLMLNQDRSITEKMTLFWHNHFATQMYVIQDARYCYKHHAMLRANALGNFKALTRLVTTDPGMLVYLNGNTNKAGSPNENYGRELQELFTVGKGPDSKYTQDDVVAAARVLTGWRDNKTSLTSYFDSTNNRHDATDKQFSAFYNNTVITGQSGANGALETDQLMDMIFAQKEASKFLCRKLYRWFIYYVIDSQVETDIITPLADLLVQNNFEIVPVLSKLLKSEHFFDSLNVGCHIKNPIDHVIGSCRQFNIAFPDSSDVTKQYNGWRIIANVLVLLTQDPGDPPNVAGWPAYYEVPQFHELWINSDTLPARNQITDAVSALTGYTQYGVNLKIDFIAFAKQFTDPSDPNLLIAESAALLSPNDLGAIQTATLKSSLLSGLTADHYWTDAWNLYLSDTSNQTNKTAVNSRLTLMYVALLRLAEYQLI